VSDARGLGTMTSLVGDDSSNADAGGRKRVPRELGDAGRLGGAERGPAAKTGLEEAVGGNVNIGREGDCARGDPVGESSDSDGFFAAPGARMRSELGSGLVVDCSLGRGELGVENEDDGL
jgi:hypothetical protein